MVAAAEMAVAAAMVAAATMTVMAAAVAAVAMAATAMAIAAARMAVAAAAASTAVAPMISLHVKRRMPKSSAADNATSTGSTCGDYDAASHAQTLARRLALTGSATNTQARTSFLKSR
jgi:hypothetical protein